MVYDKEYYENIEKINKYRKEYNKAYQENSKRRLLKVVEKKFQTTMIGALARFEERFGLLWGHNKKDLTQDELKFKRMWEEVRTDILNNGNNQMRAAQEEIAMYTMSWDKYKVDFLVKKDKKNE